MHAVIRFNFFSIPFLLWAVIALVHNVIMSLVLGAVVALVACLNCSIFPSLVHLRHLVGPLTVFKISYSLFLLLKAFHH